MGLMQNKRGGYIDIFIFIIVALIVVVFSGMFIYMGATIKTQLHLTMDNMTEVGATNNYTELIDENIGAVNTAYQSLYWISVFLIIGMILAIFIGSYMVTTKPVFFIPYIIIVIVAIIVSVGITNGYEMLLNDGTIGSTLMGFHGSNFILLNLPIWIAVIGIGGGIIMFVKMQRGEEYYGGY